MRKLNNSAILLLLLSLCSLTAYAQQEKNSLILNLAYHNNNNLQQYLVANAKSKIDGKFRMIEGVTVSFYITSDSAKTNFLGTATTDIKGNAALLIPPSAKAEWMKAASRDFVVVSKADKQFDVSTATTTITKARLKIDTADGKIINVSVLALVDTVWTLVKDVELKVAVKRSGGDLNVSETQSYTTDSTGTIAAEFKLDTLPGDLKGNLVLIAKIEENETYGNLTAETTVPWGVPATYVSEYDKRTLFARRGFTPYWLELMAYSIIVVVWGVLFYLFMQIKKLKKLGIE